jgi:hypothetical protein
MDDQPNIGIGPRLLVVADGAEPRLSLAGYGALSRLLALCPFLQLSLA